MPDYTATVRKYAKLNGLDSALVLKVIAAESNGNPRAVSRKGAVGLMQLLPATADELGVTDAFDPEQNIRGGTQYLAALMQQFPDQRSAVAAYNFGPGNVSAGKPWPKETKDYVAKVLGPLTARIHGQSYQVGDVVAKGRHAGKTVTEIDEASGIPTLRKYPNTNSLVSDPEFQRFPLAERVAALQKIGADPSYIRSYEELSRPTVTVAQLNADPDFKKFSPEAQARILRRLVGDDAADRHPVAVMNRLLGVRPAP